MKNGKESPKSNPPKISKFLEILKNHQVEQVPKGKNDKVIEINSNTSLIDGFKTLVNHNILSIPVWDEQLKLYTGFLDISDLISFVIFAYDQHNYFKHYSLDEVVNIGVRKLCPYNKQVSVTYLSRRNIFKPVTEGCSVLDVVLTLAKGVHRVPVVNSQGRCVRIISQSSLMKFFHDHSSMLSEEISISLKDAGLAYKEVVDVSVGTLAIDTFRTLDQHCLSGVCVVDHEGRMVDQTSGSDLKRLVQQNNISLLNVPIMDFLAQIRLQTNDNKPRCCNLYHSNNISKVISTLVSTGHHRVFVTNRQNRPIGVVSITDILRYVSKSYEPNLVFPSDVLTCPVCSNPNQLQSPSPISNNSNENYDLSPQDLNQFFKHKPTTFTKSLNSPLSTHSPTSHKIIWPSNIYLPPETTLNSDSENTDILFTPSPLNSPCERGTDVPSPVFWCEESSSFSLYPSEHRKRPLPTSSINLTKKYKE